MTIVVDLRQNKQNTNISASTKIAASTKFAAGTKNPASTNFVPATIFVLAANLVLVAFFGPFYYAGSHECHDSQKRSSHLGFWSIIVFVIKFC